MMKYFKRIFIFIILPICLVVWFIVALYLVLSKENKIDIIPIFGTWLAATIAFIFKVQAEERTTKEIFDEFNKRYDERFNDVFNTLRRGNEAKKLTKDELKNLIIDYFNMCSEQYLWYSKGLIPNDIWDAWESGMKANLKIDEIKALWKTEKENGDTKHSYYGLLEHLKNEKI